jgi:hypothetical protein
MFVQNWFLLCSLYDKIQDANVVVVVVVEIVTCELLERVRRVGSQMLVATWLSTPASVDLF